MCTDPFDLSSPHPQLLNIASGGIETSEVENIMVNYIKKGKGLAKLFR